MSCFWRGRNSHKVRSPDHSSRGCLKWSDAFQREIFVLDYIDFGVTIQWGFQYKESTTLWTNTHFHLLQALFSLVTQVHFWTCHVILLLKSRIWISTFTSKRIVSYSHIHTFCWGGTEAAPLTCTKSWGINQIYWMWQRITIKGGILFFCHPCSRKQAC